MNGCSLKQIVTKPTRGKAILDKVYTNMRDYHTIPEIYPDHSAVLCSPGLRTTYEPPSVKTISSRRQGPQQRQQLLEALSSISWEPLYRASTREEQYAIFYYIMTKLINTHLPVQQKRRCTTDRPWVTDHFKDLIRKRQSAFKSGNANVYNFYSNRVNRLSKYLQREHYNTKIDSLCSNSVVERHQTDCRLKIRGRQPTMSG